MPMLRLFFSSLVYLTILTRFTGTKSIIPNDEYFRIPDANYPENYKSQSQFKTNLMVGQNLDHRQEQLKNLRFEPYHQLRSKTFSDLPTDEYFRIPDAHNPSPAEEKATIKPNLVHYNNLGNYKERIKNVESDQNVLLSDTKLFAATQSTYTKNKPDEKCIEINDALHTRNSHFIEPDSKSIPHSIAGENLDHGDENILRRSEEKSKNLKYPQSYYEDTKLFPDPQSSSGKTISEDDYYQIPDDPVSSVSSHVKEPKIQNKPSLISVKELHHPIKEEEKHIKMKQNNHDKYAQQFADSHLSSIENNSRVKYSVIADVSKQKRFHFMQQEPQLKQTSITDQHTLVHSNQQEYRNQKLDNHDNTKLFSDGLPSLVKRTPDKEYLEVHEAYTTPNPQIIQFGVQNKPNLINEENLDQSKEKSKNMKLHTDPKQFPDSQSSYVTNTLEDDYYRIPDDTPNKITSHVKQPELKFKTNLISDYKLDNFEDNYEKIELNSNKNADTKLFTDTPQSLAKNTPDMEYLKATPTSRSNCIQVESLNTEYRTNLIKINNNLQQQSKNLQVQQQDHADTRPRADTQSINITDEISDDYFRIPEAHTTSIEDEPNPNLMGNKNLNHFDEEPKYLKFEHADTQLEPRADSSSEEESTETSQGANADEQVIKISTNFLESTETSAENDTPENIPIISTNSHSDCFEVSTTVSPIAYPSSPTTPMDFSTDSTQSFTNSNLYSEIPPPEPPISHPPKSYPITQVPQTHVNYFTESTFSGHLAIPTKKSPSTYPPNRITDMPQNYFNYPTEFNPNNYLQTPSTKSPITYSPTSKTDISQTNFNYPTESTFFGHIPLPPIKPPIIYPLRPVIPTFSNNPKSTHQSHEHRPKIKNTVFSIPYPHLPSPRNDAPKIIRSHRPTESISQFMPHPPISPTVSPISYPPNPITHSPETITSSYLTESIFHSDHPPITPTVSPIAYPRSSVSYSSQPTSSISPVNSMTHPIQPTHNVNPKSSLHSKNPTIYHPVPISPIPNPIISPPPNSPKNSKTFSDSDRNIHPPTNPNNRWYTPPNFPPITFPQYPIVPVGSLDKSKTFIEPNNNSDQERGINRMRSNNIYIVL